jgi:hypothetical protein
MAASVKADRRIALTRGDERGRATSPAAHVVPLTLAGKMTARVSVRTDLPSLKPLFPFEEQIREHRNHQHENECSRIPECPIEFGDALEVHSID